MTNAKADANDANRDPLTGESGSHPVGTGLGAVVGALVAGATVGMAAGPLGTVVGGAVGAVAGGLAGNAAEETINPTLEDADPLPVPQGTGSPTEAPAAR